MVINRDEYLSEIIKRKWNGLVKVITGLRRCGKSFLLFELFQGHLLESGVGKESIVTFAFDTDDDIDKLDSYFPEEPTKIIDPRTKTYIVNSKKFRAYIRDLTEGNGDYYLLLDEIQLLDNFVGTLNGFLKDKRFDVYVTGSNSKMLSNDIITTFRGRGDPIKVSPLSFREFFRASGLSFSEAYKEYSYYGGMPLVALMSDEVQKSLYLSNLFEEIYIKDILERREISEVDSFGRLINVLASSIGSYASPTTISNTFKSDLGVAYHHDTIKRHIESLKNSFLIREANRYDVKGRRYIEAKNKYYFADIGLRNARLGFREQEPTHIMENIIYNELWTRGYSIDVGIVETFERNAQGNNVRKQLEVDFVCRRGNDTFYVQSAYRLPDEAKMEQEERPLRLIADSFQKIIVTREDIKTYRTANGTIVMSLETFLLSFDRMGL